MKTTIGSVISLNGKVVSRSRNLRGLLTYATRYDVTHAGEIEIDQGKGLLVVLYGNGAVGHANFASLSVMRKWVKARRSWSVNH